jgi:hypothetical protein
MRLYVSLPNRPKRPIYPRNLLFLLHTHTRERVAIFVQTVNSPARSALGKRRGKTQQAQAHLPQLSMTWVRKMSGLRRTKSAIIDLSVGNQSMPGRSFASPVSCVVVRSGTVLFGQG